MQKTIKKLCIAVSISFKNRENSFDL